MAKNIQFSLDQTLSFMEAEFAHYDLNRDPGETLDVQELFPEVVAELEALP